MKEKLIRPIFRFFNSKTKNAEIYINNGSVWLIFTNEKRWVFELTKEGTLWYNYYFFENILKYFSLEVVKNQDYITKWVENFIQNGVKHTDACQIGTSTSIEDAIQNGVKHIQWWTNQRKNPIEDTIQNGVKETKHNPFEDGLAMEEAIQNGVKDIGPHGGARLKPVEDTIQNGVKDIIPVLLEFSTTVEDTIQNGVKRTTPASSPCWKLVEDVVQNGVKETTPGGYLGSVEMRGKTVHQFESPKQNNEVEDVIENGIKETVSIASHRTWKSEEVIQNGIKETNPHFLEILNPINFEPVIKEMKRMNEVNIVLEEGIKEVKELPDKSGELKGYGDYYSRQEDRTKPHTEYVKDVLEDGIKETKYCELHSLMRADHIIRDGIKETHWKRVDNHPTFVDRIINSEIQN